MYMYGKRICVLTLFSIYFISIEGTNRSFPAILAFGDSIVDTGNNNYLFTVMRGNYWPYGWNFDSKIPTGRFGNGRVFSDVVAERLGIKRIVPAYRKLYISQRDLRTGVSFASGGTGVDPETSKMLKVLSPQDQVRDLKSYIKKLKGIVGDSKAKEIVANAVILVSQGNNDIGITYSSALSTCKEIMAPNIYTRKLVHLNKKFMKDLYDQGARKFAVMGAIPLGCLPMSRIFLGVIVMWCNFFANKVSQDYNRNLKIGIKNWRGDSGFSGAKFVYVDMYNSIMDVIQNYKHYGFSNSKNGCCCMLTAIIPCTNPDKYVFYDFAHPSEQTYKTIAEKLVEDIKKGLS